MEVFVGPRDQIPEGIKERLAEIGQAVLNFRRHCGIYSSNDVAILLQASQRLREHSRRYVADLSLDIRKSSSLAMSQRGNDQQAPPISDAINDISNGAIGGVTEIRSYRIARRHLEFHALRPKAYSIQRKKPAIERLSVAGAGIRQLHTAGSRPYRLTGPS